MLRQHRRHLSTSQLLTCYVTWPASKPLTRISVISMDLLDMKLRLGVSRSYFGRNKSTVLNVYTLQMLKVVVAQLYQSPAKVTCSSPSVVGDEQKNKKQTKQTNKRTTTTTKKKTSERKKQRKSPSSFFLSLVHFFQSSPTNNLNSSAIISQHQYHYQPVIVIFCHFFH